MQKPISSSSNGSVLSSIAPVSNKNPVNQNLGVYLYLQDHTCFHQRSRQPRACREEWFPVAHIREKGWWIQKSCTVSLATLAHLTVVLALANACGASWVVRFEQYIQTDAWDLTFSVRQLPIMTKERISDLNRSLCNNEEFVNPNTIYV